MSRSKMYDELIRLILEAPEDDETEDDVEEESEDESTQSVQTDSEEGTEGEQDQPDSSIDDQEPDSQDQTDMGDSQFGGMPEEEPEPEPEELRSEWVELDSLYKSLSKLQALVRRIVKNFENKLYYVVDNDGFNLARKRYDSFIWLDERLDNVLEMPFVPDNLDKIKKVYNLLYDESHRQIRLLKNSKLLKRKPMRKK